MYSLWRGEKCLGYFEETQPVMHHDRRVGAAGILVPNEDIDEDCAMMQTRVEIFPDSPTFQSPEPIRWIGQRVEHGCQLYPSSGALEPLSPEAARGVSADKIYEIRDERGERLDVTLVTLHLTRFASAAEAKQWREANGITGDADRFWSVMFASSVTSK
jgi:hypothetical protein